MLECNSWHDIVWIGHASPLGDVRRWPLRRTFASRLVDEARTRRRSPFLTQWCCLHLHPPTTGRCRSPWWTVSCCWPSQRLCWPRSMGRWPQRAPVLRDSVRHRRSGAPANLCTEATSGNMIYQRMSIHPNYTYIHASYIDSLQHKGTMSTKPVFKKIAKTQRSYMSHYVDIRHLCFLHLHVLWLSLKKITIFSNDVNKTSTSVELLAILRYMS